MRLIGIPVVDKTERRKLTCWKVIPTITRTAMASTSTDLREKPKAVYKCG